MVCTGFALFSDANEAVSAGFSASGIDGLTPTNSLSQLEGWRPSHAELGKSWQFVFYVLKHLINCWHLSMTMTECIIQIFHKLMQVPQLLFFETVGCTRQPHKGLAMRDSFARKFSTDLGTLQLVNAFKGKKQKGMDGNGLQSTQRCAMIPLPSGDQKVPGIWKRRGA